MFLHSLAVGPIGTNCYLAGDEETRRCAVIDPGEEGERIYHYAITHGYKPALVLLTHGHFDHVNGVRELLSLAGELPVYIHKADYPYAPAGYYSPKGLGQLNNISFYDEGDTVTLDGLTFHVHHTPGHTAGSVSLTVGDALFSGDTLFAGSCGRTDFETSNARQMLASLKKLAELEGDYKVYPGHEDFSTLDEERKINPYIDLAVNGRRKR